MISDTLSFDSEHLTTLAAVVTKDLRHLMSQVTPKLRDGLVTPLKLETESLEKEVALLTRAARVAEEATESVTLALKDSPEISRLLTEALGKKGTAAVAELLSVAVGAALRRELESRLLPIFSETLANSEISRLSVSAEAAKDLEILTLKIEQLERAAGKILAAAENQRKETEKIAREIESTNFQEIIDEVIKPLLGQQNLRGLIDAGQFDAAISLVLKSPAALEEFLAAESPEFWLDKFPGPVQKRSLALAVARSLADSVSPAAVSRVEWVFEIILSLGPGERPGNFFEEIGEQLSLVDSRGDKKFASKISQCLRLVRSLQW